VEGGSLTLMLASGDNSDFSPAAFRQDLQIMVSYLDPLVWIDEVTMEPRPWLAESWEWNDDHTVITYHLRKNVRWHDGTELTSRDVVFSLYVYRDDLDSAVRNFFTTMASAETDGKYGVKVTLTEPDGNWLLNASNQFIIQRKQYLDYWESRPEGERTLSGFNWRKNPPLGTGPWAIEKRNEQQITLSRWKRYWAGRPYAEELTLTWSGDREARINAWKTGQSDLLWPVRPADLPLAADTPGRLYVSDSASVMFAAFNFDNPARKPRDLFKDVRVRRALSLAIDRERYAREVFHGFIHADRAGTIAQPWAYDPSVRNPPRDVAAARSLLSEAGWSDTDGDGVLEDAEGNRLELSVILRNDARPELLAVLQSIVPDLKEVGVALRVRALAPDRFVDAWTSTRNYDLIAYAYALYPGFTDFDLYGSDWDIRNNPQGWNPGGYRNADADEAIRDALAARSMEGLRNALRRLQQAVNDDLFALWFGFPQDLTLVRSDIQGFQPHILLPTWNTRLLWRAAPGGA
jgi:peptide/nickel transport system substrate-binding protein